MYNKFQNLIKRCDIVGQENNLFHKGSDKHRSILGGFLTILVIGGIIGMTWILGNDMILREKPLILIKSILSGERPQIILNPQTLPISVVLTDFESFPIVDNEMFSMTFSVVQLNNGEGTSEEVFFDLVPCRYEDFPNFDEEKFDATGLGNYFCPDKYNLTISGYWDEPIVNYISIKCFRCMETETQSCKSKEEIDAFMSNGYIMNLYLQNSVADLTEYSNPITKYIVNIFKGIQIGTSKSYEIFLQPNQITTDSGFIFEEISVEDYISIGGKELDSATFSEEDEKYFEFDIFPSNDKFINIRSYIKAQEIAANLGGIMELLFIVSRIANMYFCLTLRNLDIINVLVDARLSTRNEKLDLKDNRENKGNKVRLVDPQKFGQKFKEKMMSKMGKNKEFDSRVNNNNEASPDMNQGNDNISIYSRNSNNSNIDIKETERRNIKNNYIEGENHEVTGKIDQGQTNQNNSERNNERNLNDMNNMNNHESSSTNAEGRLNSIKKHNTLNSPMNIIVNNLNNTNNLNKMKSLKSNKDINIVENNNSNNNNSILEPPHLPNNKKTQDLSIIDLEADELQKKRILNETLVQINQVKPLRNYQKQPSKLENIQIIEDKDLPVQKEDEAKEKDELLYLTYGEIVRMLFSHCFCKKICCDNDDFKLRRQFYLKNEKFVEKALDIIDIIKSSSIYRIIDENRKMMEEQDYVMDEIRKSFISLKVK